MLKDKITKLLMKKVGKLRSEDAKSGNNVNSYEIEKICKKIKAMNRG